MINIATSPARHAIIYLHKTRSHLKYDETITEIRVQIVDCRVDPQRVHPVSVHLLLPRLLDAALLDGLDVLLLGWVKGREVVEEIGHKSQVELLLTLDHVLGGDKGSALDLVSLIQHELRPLQEVLTGHGLLVNSGPLWCYLVDQLSVNLTVLDVIVKIVNSSVRPSLRSF